MNLIVAFYIAVFLGASAVSGIAFGAGFGEVASRIIGLSSGIFFGVFVDRRYGRRGHN